MWEEVDAYTVYPRIAEWKNDLQEIDQDTAEVKIADNLQETMMNTHEIRTWISKPTIT